MKIIGLKSRLIFLFGVIIGYFILRDKAIIILGGLFYFISSIFLAQLFIINNDFLSVIYFIPPKRTKKISIRDIRKVIIDAQWSYSSISITTDNGIIKSFCDVPPWELKSLYLFLQSANIPIDRSGFAVTWDP